MQKYKPYQDLPATIQAKLYQINKKREELDGLYAELKSSFHLQALWPEAFDYGKITTRLTGSPFKLVEMRFVIVAGNGDQKDFPLVEVYDKYPDLIQPYLKQWGDEDRSGSLAYFYNRHAESRMAMEKLKQSKTIT